jgi:hypothetical protein
MCAKTKVRENKKRMELQDDIQSILRHSGIFAPHLERLQQVSSQMRAMEWKIVRRDAASSGPAMATANRTRE